MTAVMSRSTRDLDVRLGEYPTAQEWRGLANRAKFHGMTLEIVETGDRVDHFVCEPKTGQRQQVTAVSCDCRQFIQGGSCACQHVALLLAEKDWLPAVTLTEVIR